MAEIVIRAVIQKAAAIAGDLLLEEGFHLSKLRQNIVWIESEMRYIESYLEDADAKHDQTDQSRAVAALVNDIRGLGLDVEDILDKYFPEIASPRRKGLFGGLRSAFHIFGHVRAVHNFVAEVEDIKKRVNDINRRRQAYGIQENGGGNNGVLWDVRRSFPHVDEPNVVGFNKHIQILQGKLLDEDTQFSIISIVGMAGLGKTTLAKKVYNSVLRNFQSTAWIYVSQQPNVTELLQDIARQVGLKEEQWKHNVEANLFSFLSQRRYVIVIDDIWQNEPWIALKNGIPTNFNNGSRVILTSRNTNVGVSIGGESSLYELQPLDQENSRKLFFKMVGVIEKIEETIGHLELENIVEKILGKCGGVPLAIVLIAGMLLLRERTISAWNDVLMNMGEEDRSSKIFFLSYKDLPTELKPCFLYFGLFPEDYEIFAFDLINMWEAEGLIRSYGNRDVQEVGEDYLYHLIVRNLIQVDRRRFDGRVKSLRIHDILHSLCVKVAKKNNFFISTHENMARENCTTAMRVRRVAAHHRKCLLLDHKNLKLRTFMSFNKGEEIETKYMKFLESQKFLKTLNLELCLDNGELDDREWPSGIDNLSRLKYIRLEAPNNWIKLPYSVSKLKNLQTFDIRRCEGLEISSYFWEKMKQLKHVFLPRDLFINDNSSRFRLNHLLPTEQATFENLQTLWGLDIRLLPDTGLRQFPNLKKLRLRFPKRELLSRLKNILNAITHSNKLEILKLEDDGISFSGAWCYDQKLNLSRFENLLKLQLRAYINYLPDLPQNLIKVTLVNTEFVEPPMESLKRLPKLKILKLGFSSLACTSLSCSGGPSSFPQLQVLEIHEQGMLQLSLSLEEEVMPRLEKLRLCGDSITLLEIPHRILQLLVQDSPRP